MSEGGTLNGLTSWYLRGALIAVNQGELITLKIEIFYKMFGHSFKLRVKYVTSKTVH